MIFRKTPNKLRIFFFNIFLFLLVIPSFASLARPGFFPMQDDLQAFRIFEMSKCLTDLQIPCRWVQDAGYGYGYPLFNFYAPGVYYIGSLIHFAGFQIIDSVKILFALGFLVSFFSMYKLSKELFGKCAAVVSAMLFTYAPFRAQEVYVRGALSEFWAVSLLPLPLLFSYRLIKRPDKDTFIKLALSVFLLLVTHNLIPLIFFPFFFVWIVYWISTLGKVKSIKPLVFSLVLGGAASSFFILPMFFEKDLVHADTILSGYFDYRRHFVSLRQMFFSNVFGYGSSDLGENDDLAIHTGVVHWIVAVFALLLVFFKKGKEQKTHLSLTLVLGGATLAYLFLMHLRSSFIWELVTPLKWLQFPWRMLSMTILSTSIMAGMFVSIFNKFGKVISISLVVLVFLSYVSFFHPKDWVNITDVQKFSGELWEKQLTISIFDYLPIFAERPPDVKAPDYPEILGGEVEIVRYQKGSNWQEGVLDVRSDAVIRLPIFYFPGMKVFVDGTETTFVYNNCDNQEVCLGLPTVNITAGDHELYVKMEDTPARKISNLFTIIGLGLLILFNKFQKLKLIIGLND